MFFGDGCFSVQDPNIFPPSTIPYVSWLKPQIHEHDLLSKPLMQTLPQAELTTMALIRMIGTTGSPIHQRNI